MTTTAVFQKEKDFYTSKQECLDSKFHQSPTNPRYKTFLQSHFTAGDEEQFEQYRDASNNNDFCPKDISISSNIFSEDTIPIADNNQDLHANSVIDTFRYLFNKFKKGIFVKIVDNKLKVFLPFSKHNFHNEWSDRIKVDPKYSSFNDFIKYITEQSGFRFNPQFVNPNIEEWYGNNCLVRYDLTKIQVPHGTSFRTEFIPTEGDSNVGNVKNMFEELCATRNIPDIEFFINRRDFPLLTRDGTEPYNNIWDGFIPLVSHNYPKYSPILSMSTADVYADLAMPTWEDWARVQSQEGIWFPKSCRDYNETFNKDWDSKMPIAVFRGGTTGCGTTPETNPRLKIAEISAKQNPDDIYLNAGITNWNLRPRKIQGQKYLQTIDLKSLGFNLVPKMSPKEQSNYKYIVNIPGHVAAFRLSVELNMGSVVLLVDSPWKLWYSNLLIPYKHYVPVKQDLSDLISQIKWCRENDDKCREIVKNAQDFFDTYLQKDGILDFMQKMLVDLKNTMGNYLYNTISPLDQQIQNELSMLKYSYPSTEKILENISTIPKINRCYGLLQGMQLLINKILTESTFETHAKYDKMLARNKLGIINLYNLANFPLAVKTTEDPSKFKEHIHETFIGINSINKLIQYIPNFAYIFGLYQTGNKYSVITEYIPGMTFFEYIKSPHFTFENYLFILSQIALALQVAQNNCCLVHYDVTPWNIIIQILPEEKEFDYILSHEKVVRVKTNIIPVIIDYGKSHVTHNNIHYGFVNMFKFSTIQDIITLLVKSIEQVIQKSLDKEFKYLLHLANFMTGNKYREAPFSSAKDLKSWLKKAKNYSHLISSDKDTLETKTPISLLNYIRKMKDYTLISKNIIYSPDRKFTNKMDKGNGRQVYEYILSPTLDMKAQTYIDVFTRFNECSLPQPKNIFFIYFAAQKLENNLESVYRQMTSFLQEHAFDTSNYDKFYYEAVELLKNEYLSRINITKTQEITYILPDNFVTLLPAPYTDETFLIPETIKSLIQTIKPKTEIIDYKEIIELILVNNSELYSMDKNTLKYYKTAFEKILTINNVNILNNIANNKTLLLLSQQIYDKNIETLKQYIIKQDCPSVNEYIDKYTEILDEIFKLSS
jgi:hypothetical protein